MSDTSVDGIDAALVDIRGTETNLKVNLLAGETFPYPEDLRARILVELEKCSLNVQTQIF